jgi:hypothetical protein
MAVHKNVDATRIRVPGASVAMLNEAGTAPVPLVASGHRESFHH